MATKKRAKRFKGDADLSKVSLKAGDEVLVISGAEITSMGPGGTVEKTDKDREIVVSFVIPGTSDRDPQVIFKDRGYYYQVNLNDVLKYRVG